MSPPERLLWQFLRQRPNGLKFRRQHPLEPYVVDFFCREAALVVEIDGWSHATADGAGREEKRDTAFRRRGLDVLHVAADEVMRDPTIVVAAILDRAGNPHASHGPPLREQGGLE